MASDTYMSVTLFGTSEKGMNLLIDVGRQKGS